KDQRDIRFVYAHIGVRERVYQLTIHPVSCPQTKFALLIIEDVDCPSLCTRKLRRIGDNCGKDSFEFERRVHRLRYVTKGAPLLNGAAKFGGPLTQFIQ